MKRRIVATLISLLWGSFAFIGYYLISVNTRHHAPGYPSAGPWLLCVYFPLLMLVIGIALLLLARRIPVALFVIIGLLQIVIFIPFLVVEYGPGPPKPIVVP